MTSTGLYSNADVVVGLAKATDPGGRDANADAAWLEHNPHGAAAAVVDGIGTSAGVVQAARRAAECAAVVASHRGALAGLMAGADVVPDYAGAPNAVAAVVSVDPDGQIDIAHVGDAAVWLWSADRGLRRWTADQTAGALIAHMLTNPELTTTEREVLERAGAAVPVMDSYLLNTLADATVSTVSSARLRAADALADVVLVTSDGVHKRLSNDEIAAVLECHVSDAQAIADAVVHAAITAPAAADEVVDNATAAVLVLCRPN